jgi:hypothetical protein
VTDSEADQLRKQKDASREKKSGVSNNEVVPIADPTIQAKTPQGK